MASQGAMTWEGASGQKYEFEVWSRDITLPTKAGVYIVTARESDPNDGYLHTAIYVGETGNLRERFESHDHSLCFDRHRANCICVHYEPNQETRRRIEKDLLDNRDPPCNKQ